MPNVIAVGVVFAAMFVSPADEVSFLARIEREDLIFNGKPVSRIDRDPDGNVVRLQLDGLRLSADDFKSLSRVKTLRVLSLRRTNVTDADLRQLQSLPKLEYLVLTSTEVSDLAIDEIVKMPAVRTICLGDVNISPEAVAKLKDHFQAKDRRLSLGYSQRKTP